MSRVLLKYYVAMVTIFVRFPIEIKCCSTTTSAIITLMSVNPNYKFDPCYIQWKTAQDGKLSELWARRAELEKNAYEYNQRRRENEAIERANRQKSYSYTVASSKKSESSVWKVLGGLIGAIVGLCCCLACVTAVCESDEPTPTTATNIPQSASTQIQLTSVVSSNLLGNSSTFNTNAINNFSGLTASSSQQDSHDNVPLMMPKRQNSLPSYEDAVKISAAPQ